MFHLINKINLIKANRKRQAILQKKLQHNRKRQEILQKKLQNNTRKIEYVKDEERINFYLGNLEKNISFKDLYNNFENTCLLDPTLYKFLSMEELKTKINQMVDNNSKKLYLELLYNTLVKYNIPKDFIFFVKTQDVMEVINIPCFTKNIIY
jgi:hypothetical protein